MSDLSWDDFRLVKAIAETHSLAGAAQRLAINPSTVFRRLGQAEEQLGIKLFERHRTGYALTPAGEEMVGLAHQFDEAANSFQLKLAGKEIRPAGELRVTTTDSLFAYLLTPIFAEIRRRYPELRFDVLITNQSLNLSRRDADVAVRATDNPPENLIGRRVGTLGWGIYGGASTCMGCGMSLDEAVEKLPWVTLGDPLSHVRAARFVRERVAPERIVCKVSSVLGLTELMQSGMGVGPLPCFYAATRPDVVALKTPVPEFSTGLWLLTHPDLRHSPRVRAFMDVAAEILTRMRPQLEGMPLENGEARQAIA
jgi:DNA-binding transcriptional LysR family regulator